MQAGDVVHLKSGGPDMTIKWVRDDEAWCQWFVNGEVKGQKFSLASLAKDDAA